MSEPRSNRLCRETAPMDYEEHLFGLELGRINRLRYTPDAPVAKRPLVSVQTAITIVSVVTAIIVLWVSR